MAIIETSINIEKCRLGRFCEAASLLNISESELLSILLQKSRRLFGEQAVTGQTVKYQRGADSGSFTIRHISLKDVDYELAVGRRYLFKISVSFLFRLAIDCFLDEIIEEMTLSPELSAGKRREYLTNFHYRHFAIHHKYTSSSELWIIPWPGETKTT